MRTIFADWCVYCDGFVPPTSKSCKSGWMAEWSKAVDSSSNFRDGVITSFWVKSSTIYGCVGSNPTSVTAITFCTFLHFLALSFCLAFFLKSLHDNFILYTFFVCIQLVMQAMSFLKHCWYSKVFNVMTSKLFC